MSLKNRRWPTRGFTLIELIVVILILGILAAVAVVGYTQITGRANVTATKANLAQVAKAALVQATVAPASGTGDGRFTREQFLAVMTDAAGTVAPALSAAAWELGDNDDAPVRSGQFALGFDEFDQEVVDTTGSRAALVAATDAGDLYAVVATTDGTLTSPVEVPAGTTPEAVLVAIPTGGTTPVFDTDGEQAPALAAPVDVSAVAGDASATVTWAAAPAAVRYTVTATPVGEGAPVSLETTATTASLNGLTNGLTYLVSVTAHNTQGAAAVSVPVTATPAAAVAASPSRLVSADAESQDQFGVSLAVDGDTLVVGAPGDGAWVGAVYVFTRSSTGWEQQGKLVAPDGATNDQFGLVVALDGDTLLIGSGYSNSTYVFTRAGATWTHQETIAAGGPIALDGDTALVGASGGTLVWTRTGATWSQQAQLSVAPGHEGSVALDGDTALIGSPNDPSHTGGATYVFTRTGTTWSEQAQLTTLDVRPYDARFGSDVALDGDTAVVGAYTDTVGTQWSGSAYVFTRTGATWSQQAKLTAPDGHDDAWFGEFVAVEGDTVVVAAQNDGGLGYYAGAAYVFARTGTTWEQLVKLTAPAGVAGDHFGSAVTIDGDTAVVGAFEAVVDAPNFWPGAVWVMPIG